MKKHKSNKRVVIVVGIVLCGSLFLLFSETKNFDELVKEYAVSNYEKIGLKNIGDKVMLTASQLYEKNIIDTKIYNENKDVIVAIIFNKNNEIEIQKYDSKMDTAAPVILLNGIEEMTIKVGQLFVDPGVNRIIDNFDGNITDKVKINGSVNSTEVGTYEIIYSVTDFAGNEAKVIRKVNVTN